MENRKVSGAYLHSPIFVPTGGKGINLKDTIQEIKGSAGIIRDLEMTYDGLNLTIKVNGVEVVVPSANVKCAVLKPLDK